MGDQIIEETELQPIKNKRSSSDVTLSAIEIKPLLKKSQTVDNGKNTGTMTKSKSQDSKGSKSAKSNGKGAKKSQKKASPLPNLSCRSHLMALSVRGFFSLHAAIAFWRVYETQATLEKSGLSKWMWYCNLGGIACLVLETFVTLVYRGGKDYKWFCPCVFFYLCSIIPSMIMLEYNEFYQECIGDEIDLDGRARRSLALDDWRFPRDVDSNISSSLNGTLMDQIVQATTTQITTTLPLVGSDNAKDKVARILLDGVNGGGKVLDDVNNALNAGLESTLDIIESLNMANQAWVLGLHQVLLFFLVIGRWMLPRGGISREQLSQLLLVFIGTGADILEFVSETVEDGLENVCRPSFRYLIWAVWAWSLLQFTMVLTASAGKKRCPATTSDETKADMEKGCGCMCCHGFFSNPDVWGMLMTLFLQDLPFLSARIYFMIWLNIRSQMLYFFALKNLLVVFLQIYRLIILWGLINNE